MGTAGAPRDPRQRKYEKRSVESTNCEKSAVNVSKSVETQVNESTPNMRLVIIAMPSMVYRGAEQ